MFEHLVGNHHVKEYLLHSLEKQCIGNSLLFAGPEGVGKGLFAKEFAAAVLCADDPSGNHRRKIEKGSHPDLHIYMPEGKTGMHSIDAMRQFNTEVYMPPMEAKRKVFVIQDAERMLPYSANALLKTFEEPSLDTLIILVSSRPSALLTTILSRCRKLYFHAMTVEEIVHVLEKEGVDPANARLIAPIAQGSVSQALRLLQPQFAARRDKVLKALCRGQLADYNELSKLAQELTKEIEGANEEWAQLMREEAKKGFSDKPTATQQQAIDKEIDGAVAMRERTEVQSIFEIILSWYRDLELLKVGADASRVINSEYISDLNKRSLAGALLPLDAIFKAIQDVQISQERSTGLNICLENLFLKINLL